MYCKSMDNAKPKCKRNLAFQAPKSSPSGNATVKYCKIFCNCATVQFYLNVELYCSTILKPKTIFYSVSDSLLYFLSISLFSVCWRGGFIAMVDGFLDQQQQDRWWFFCGFFLVVASRCCGGFAWWWLGFFPGGLFVAG